MRPLDHNEALYVGWKWRELRIVNRVQMIGAAVIALVALAGAGLFFVLPRRHDGVDAFIVVFQVLMLAIALGFAFVFFVRLRLARADSPEPSMAFEINGPFWEQASARSMTRCGIGDTYLTIPLHWVPLLRRAGASRVLSAEVVAGPAETSILLSVEGKLSVSDEVARGYLGGRTSLAPLFALLATIGVVLAGTVAGASYDADLTLWRYLHVDHGLARFSSVAEFDHAHPAAFGRVQLASVTLTRSGFDTAVARDEPPADLDEAKRLTREAERIALDIAQAPCPDDTADCKPRELQGHTEATARQVSKLLDDAETWVARLAAARPGGVAVRGQSDPGPDLARPSAYFQQARQTLGTEADRAKRAEERAAERIEQVLSLMPAGHRSADMLAMARETARRVIAQEAEAELGQLLPVAEAEIAETASAVARRYTLEGILYRRPSGEAWLAVNARYSTWALYAQACTCVTAVLSAILIALSAASIARGRKIYRQLVAALPRSL